MSQKADEFSKERARLNEIVMQYADLGIKRFFSLDGQVYREGVLDTKTKELMGLVASAVLRCDDCIQYHVIESRKAGATDQEFEETMAIGLIVGGSIVIPHLRRAFEMWHELRAADE
ncbi:carboxymuconolactone decarboxylase family protein [bacterium]|nr:carboxymuconolactone decarboxylase family protein [bacterium]MBU1652090.1 carboxymuconolactone decarboxylase family protein [bacterium]